MHSKLIDALKLDNHAVAVLHTDERPQPALQFQPGKWGCVVSMFVAASKGKTAVFDSDTCGCNSGGIGLCLTDKLAEPPGGLAAFLSTGAGEGFREGERYIKTPQLAQQFIDRLPKLRIPQQYVVLKPLGEVDAARETPVLVVIFANTDQISALHFMANYACPGGEAVCMPWGAGCHTLHLFAFMECGKPQPRAVLGATDMTARPYLDAGTLGFSIPWALFTEMESNVEGSFMTHGDWPKLLAKRAVG
jgi:uncharacterized protein (DUF169 family)